MVSMLWKEKNYLTDAQYIIGRHIYEYDISKANINVLYYLGEIDHDYYEKLKRMPRMKRQIEIGYLLKYNEGLADKLSEGIANFRRLLFEDNQLEDMDILSIKNDAIFVIGKRLSVTKFDNVEFVLKNHYTTYVRLDKHLEIYAESNSVDGTMSLDVKGISDLKLELHHQYMATMLADVVYYMETHDIKDGLTYLGDIYNKYIEKQLPPGYYRNFNAESDFTVVANGTMYSVEFCTQDMYSALDIGCNLNIIRTLYGYLTNLYMQQYS